MSHHHRIVNVQMLEKLLKIVDKGVHIVAIPSLSGAAVAAPIMCNHTVALIGQKDHLILPVITAQWPTVRESHDVTLRVAPIFVEELGSVPERQIRHIGWNCVSARVRFCGRNVNKTVNAKIDAFATAKLPFICSAIPLLRQ